MAQTPRQKTEAAARKTESKARAADFTKAVDDAMREHMSLSSDNATQAVIDRDTVAEAAAKRVALVLARSWHDVAQHKGETVDAHGVDVERAVANIAAAVDRHALERARKVWDKAAASIQYVSVREKPDSNGNTYHSVKVVFCDGTVQRIGETYGYGNHWQTTVAQALREGPEGARLPALDQTGEGYSAVGRRVARDNAHHDVVTIARTKDHYVACDRH